MAKKGRGKSTRPSLLDGDWFTHDAAKALEQTFLRFDTDRDGALCTPELQAFARACNGGEEFDEDELEQIKKYFQTDAKHALTRKGFLQMYHTQTVARPNDTWKDLQALGFNHRLELSAEAAAEQAAAKSAAEASICHDAPAGRADLAALCDESDTRYTAGKHAEALRAALNALQLDANSIVANQCAGRALFALGRVEAAERSWAKANALMEGGGGGGVLAGPHSDQCSGQHSHSQTRLDAAAADEELTSEDEDEGEGSEASAVDPTTAPPALLAAAQAAAQDMARARQVEAARLDAWEADAEDRFVAMATAALKADSEEAQAVLAKAKQTTIAARAEQEEAVANLEAAKRRLEAARDAVLVAVAAEREAERTAKARDHRYGGLIVGHDI